MEKLLSLSFRACPLGLKWIRAFWTVNFGAASKDTAAADA